MTEESAMGQRLATRLSEVSFVNKEVLAKNHKDACGGVKKDLGK